MLNKKLRYEDIRYNVDGGQRLLLLLCVFIVGFLMTSLVTLVVGTGTTARMRIVMVVQDMLMFILPALVTAVIVTRQPARLLMLSRPSATSTLLMLGALLAAVPAMNMLAAWNAGLPFPESWLAQTKEQGELISRLMGGDSVGSLVISILIIGLMGPLAEELMFRGAFQRLLSGVVGHHAAVWMVAAVFSLIHLDASGFIPRMLLGAGCGYAMIWGRSIWSAVALHAANNIIALTEIWRAGGKVDHMSQSVAGMSPLIAVISGMTAGVLIYMAYRQWRVSRNVYG